MMNNAVEVRACMTSAVRLKIECTHWRGQMRFGGEARRHARSRPKCSIISLCESVFDELGAQLGE